MDDDYEETLIPTMSLRFVEREVFAAWKEGGTKTVRILQQRFTTTGGQPVWRDVPVSREGA